MAPRVIRRGAGLVVPAARFEAERSAETLLREAESRARLILETAEASAHALLEGARAEREQLREAERAEAARAREALLVESTGDVLRLGLELARRITRHDLERDPEAYAAMAEALVAEARITGPGWLRVPEGVSVSVEGFESLTDASLSTGDLVVEAEGARLDARLDERLAAIARALETPKTS